MSTLAEIEEAIAGLPLLQQRELYRYLGAQLRGGPAVDADAKHKAVAQFLGRWTGAGTEISTEEIEDMRAERLIAKHVK